MKTLKQIEKYLSKKRPFKIDNAVLTVFIEWIDRELVKSHRKDAIKLVKLANKNEASTLCYHIISGEQPAMVLDSIKDRLFFHGELPKSGIKKFGLLSTETFKEEFDVNFSIFNPFRCYIGSEEIFPDFFDFKNKKVFFKNEWIGFDSLKIEKNYFYKHD